MTENRYKYGKIYKITSEHINKIYVGSTCKKLLSQRLAHHNSSYKKWKKNKGRYTTSYELFELGSVQITLLEACPCNTKDELLYKERYWIEQYKDIIVNKQKKPIVTNEETKERQKQYCKDNKEQISEQHKQYYENNKEFLLLKITKYRETNKEKIKERKNQPIICACGSTFIQDGKARHEKTIKHNNFIKSKLPEITPAPESG